MLIFTGNHQIQLRIQGKKLGSGSVKIIRIGIPHSSHVILCTGTPGTVLILIAPGPTLISPLEHYNTPRKVDCGFSL